MNPAPPSTPWIVDLRIWLVECGERLTVLEQILSRADSPTRRTIALLGSPTSPDERQQRLHALNVRLALISELLTAMADGAALVPPEQQLLGLLLAANLERLRALSATLKPWTDRDEEIRRYGEPPELPGLRRG